MSAPDPLAPGGWRLEAALTEVAILLRERRFTGSITLHCAEGAVAKYEVVEVRRPGQTPVVRDISEAGNARRR